MHHFLLPSWLCGSAGYLNLYNGHCMMVKDRSFKDQNDNCTVYRNVIKFVSAIAIQLDCEPGRTPLVIIYSLFNGHGSTESQSVLFCVKAYYKQIIPAYRPDRFTWPMWYRPFFKLPPFEYRYGRVYLPPIRVAWGFRLICLQIIYVRRVLPPFSKFCQSSYATRVLKYQWYNHVCTWEIRTCHS